MGYLKKVIENLRDFYKLSITVKTKKKKFRIIFSVVVRNLASFCEIIVVVLFSYILTNEKPSQTFLENIELDNFKYLIPIIVLLRVGLNYLDHINQEKLMIHTSSTLKQSAAEHLFKKENLSFSYINYKVFAETDNITSIYKIYITLLGTFFQLITFSASLIYLNYKVGLSIVLIFLVLFWPIKQIMMNFKRNTELNTENTIETHNNLDRILSNYFLIKLLKKEEQELKRFDQTINRTIDLTFKNSRLLFLNHNLFNSLMTFLVSIGIIQTFFELDLTLEIIFLLIRGAQFISQIASLYADLLSKNHFVKNYLKDLDQDEFEKLGTFKINSNLESENAFEISNVGFKYDGSSEYIFENLNLEIKKNTHNIIVGPNGSGKSTLIGIMSNIYKPNTGKILVESQDFGYIGPVPLIFKDTLLNNLTYGQEGEINNDEIINLIAELNIFDNFSESMLKEEVTSKTLSSGQMQKISFIRALLGKPQVLFLDEATSNLDFNSVELFNKKLAEYNGTLINVTHKPEQFSNVDYYFEIDAKNVKKSIRKFS